jgi:type II secretory pathway pseudopilin PulG
MIRRSFRSTRAFTLLEIMIVVTTVAILSLLAMIAVGRIKERAARTVILNNLRQLYNAKEFYFSGGPEESKNVSVATLAKYGFITETVKAKFVSPRSYESALGWHYWPMVNPGDPVVAYKGTMTHSGVPTSEAIYYPDAPTTGTAASATQAATQPPAPTVAPPAPKLPTNDPSYGRINLGTGRWDADLGLLWQMGLHTPEERAGLTVKSIQFDDPNIIATRHADGAWYVTGQNLRSGQGVRFTITVANEQGGTSTARGHTTLVR